MQVEEGVAAIGYIERGGRRGGAKGERTRGAILAAAERAFAAQGFAATRLEDVAEAVGIRRASIVYHFRDKSELYDAVLADVLGALRARIESALVGPGPLARRAEAAIGAFVDSLAERPAFARLLLREVADGAPGREPALVRHLRPFHELVERVLAREHGAAGPAVDPLHLAATVAGASVFFVAAMPTLLPGHGLDPLEPARLAGFRAELLGIARRLLGLGEP